MNSTALTLNKTFHNIFQDYRGCPVARDELAHDQATAPLHELELKARKAEQLAEVFDLADYLLNGGEYVRILADDTRLPYSRDSISERCFDNDLHPQAICNFATGKKDAGIALKDLIIRSARQVAAEALGYELDELA